MAEICFGVLSEKEASSSQADGDENRRINCYDTGFKKPRRTILPPLPSSSRKGGAAAVDNSKFQLEDDRAGGFVNGASESYPKFGVASVCGRRREMEDAVAVHPSFIYTDDDNQTSDMHYFAVFDGHGCSHVARMCERRLHLLVREELKKNEWVKTMEQSFRRMDEEVKVWNQATMGDCRCEFRGPEFYGVGSTAVVAVVTPDKIVIANCGDSRAVLCRNGKAVPLSSDHKPDRPDELSRIENAGGKVLYRDGARVCGVLAMSRAIGDNYLKPCVTCEPEVTITERTTEDDCLILASDGLWDVVSNDTACGLARRCLEEKRPSAEMKRPLVNDVSENQNCDSACSNVSLLLTKLALARRSADNVSVVVIGLRKDGSIFC